MTPRDVLLSGAAVLVALFALLFLVVLTSGFTAPGVDVGGPGWDVSPLQQMLGAR